MWYVPNELTSNNEFQCNVIHFCLITRFNCELDKKVCLSNQNIKLFFHPGLLLQYSNTVVKLLAPFPRGVNHIAMLGNNITKLLWEIWGEKFSSAESENTKVNVDQNCKIVVWPNICFQKTNKAMVYGLVHGGPYLHWYPVLFTVLPQELDG